MGLSPCLERVGLEQNDFSRHYGPWMAWDSEPEGIPQPKLSCPGPVPSQVYSHHLHPWRAGRGGRKQLAPIQSPLNPCSQPWERYCTTPNSTVLFLVSKGLEVSFPLLIPVWLLLRTKAWRKKSTWDLTPCYSPLQMLFLKVYGNHPGSSKHYKKIRNINKLQGKAEVLEWFNTSRLAHHA